MNWTMIISSRGWQALHGLAGQPAALSTGIFFTGRRAHQATPGPGKMATQDRQIACLPPALLPGRTVSVLLPPSGAAAQG